MLPKPRKIFVIIYILYAGGVFVSHSSSAATDAIITLNAVGDPPLNDELMQGFMDRVAQEAFKRIGINLHTIRLPAERGLINANEGISDGEMGRIAGLQTIYPNLIQVPESIMNWEFVVIGSDAVNFNGDWQDLIGKTVAIINGWKILETNIPKQVQVVKVKNPQLLFDLLQRKRTDLIIYERWGGTMRLKKIAMREMELKLPALAIREMYIYLNKKHQPLVERLAQALRAMKIDGSYEKIMRQTLGEYLPALPHPTVVSHHDVSMQN